MKLGTAVQFVVLNMLRYAAMQAISLSTIAKLCNLHQDPLYFSFFCIILYIVDQY